MRDKTQLIWFFAFLGPVIGGLAWLIAYISTHTSAIGFDGPASLFLIISIFCGWLLFSVAALIVFIRKHSRRKLGYALQIIFAVGAMIGFVTFALLVSYAQANYPDYYPGMMGD